MSPMSHSSHASTVGSPGWAKTTRRKVVVGVDGSSNSVAALRVAVDEAMNDGAVVEVVCAFRPIPDAADDRPVAVVARAEAEARATAQRCIALAFPDGAPPVDLRLVLRVGTAHDVLLEVARTADLLVVGARHRPEPLALLLGSTAQVCARHASCPVLVVPAAALPREPAGPVGVTDVGAD